MFLQDDLVVPVRLDLDEEQAAADYPLVQRLHHRPATGVIGATCLFTRLEESSLVPAGFLTV